MKSNNQKKMIPNKETLEAMEELEKSDRYFVNTVDELFEELDKDDNMLGSE